ncbi:MAG TPA: FAD-binding protein [Spirochaetia bacterium]|nr:FAD-binding protein [Spirochaetia bacterium]
MATLSKNVELQQFDVIIVGSGLAGMRAALQAARLSGGNSRIALISKLHAMRSHSVSAEGGISGVLFPGEANDSTELHAFDTVKGGDYLGDQPAIEILVNEAPKEIRFLDHLGTPWNRSEGGKIVLRAFGGMTVPRTVFAADKTGFFMLHALYDNLLSFPNVTIFHEHYATDLILENGEFRGFLTLELATGALRFFAGKAGIIATGGFARIYGFTTTAYSSTGDGIALAFKAGLPIKDMEFIQFHPTGLIPTGVLITEAVRGEGGYLLNSENKRFLENYAKERMELAPRDIIARAMITELNQGRGLLHEVSGMRHLLLDMRHLGEEKIDERLPMIKELTMKILGINPAHEPIPVRPSAHYTMGGIHENVRGEVMADDASRTVAGLWAAGECGCVSVHGANRLGSNSLSHCIIWGRMTGEAAQKRAAESRSAPDISGVADQVNSAADKVLKLKQQDGTEDPYQLRKELWETMDANVHVFRRTDELEKARTKLSELRARSPRILVKDKRDAFNTNLRDSLEIGNMIEIAQSVVEGALQRKESRGSHFMVEYPKRDDGSFLAHTVIYRTSDIPRISHSPVAITKWQPMERKY